MNSPVIAIKPWYRQFWPWFLILLPATVVVASLTTVYIAFNSADSLVNDDYFKEGLAINQSLKLDKTAQLLGLSADVAWDKLTGEILVTLKGDLEQPGFSENPQLQLLLLHPTDEHKDSLLPLTLIKSGYYRVALEAPLRYRYYLRLEPQEPGIWRLNGELDFESSNLVNLGSQ